MTFSMQPVPTPDVEHVTLVVDGTTLSQDMKSPLKQTFTWPGSTQNATISYRVGVEITLGGKTGLWAIWHLLDGADIWDNQPGSMERDVRESSRSAERSERSALAAEIYPRFAGVPDIPQARVLESGLHFVGGIGEVSSREVRLSRRGSCCNQLPAFNCVRSSGDHVASVAPLPFASFAIWLYIVSSFRGSMRHSSNALRPYCRSTSTAIS